MKPPAGAAGAASEMLVAPLVPLLDGCDACSTTAPEAVPVERKAITTASAAAECTFRVREVRTGCTGRYRFFTLHLPSSSSDVWSCPSPHVCCKGTPRNRQLGLRPSAKVDHRAFSQCPSGDRVVRMVDRNFRDARQNCDGNHRPLLSRARISSFS